MGDGNGGSAHHPEPGSTGDPRYAERLARLDSSWWKRALDVQRPYRWNLRHLDLGSTLDLGCELGRNLAHLDGDGVGIDHNAELVRLARERGLRVYTPEEFATSPEALPGSFDSLLCSHVLEHMSRDAAFELVHPFLRFVRPEGKVIFITPQERGLRSDHVERYDLAALDEVIDRLGLVTVSARSFPFPRAVGRVFTCNEYVVVARTHER